MAKAGKKSKTARPTTASSGGVKKKLLGGDGHSEDLKPEAARIGHKSPMPRVIHPMLATLVDKPFDSQDWLYEVKWDGYRAIAFLESGSLRLVSRNQNDMTAADPQMRPLPDSVQARTAILDGEIVALDEEGRPSFSLMQQRTGVGEGGHRIRRTRDDIPVVYYVFDLLYLDGYNLMQAELEQRKYLLADRKSVV